MNLEQHWHSINRMEGRKEIQFFHCHFLPETVFFSFSKTCIWEAYYMSLYHKALLSNVLVRFYWNVHFCSICGIRCKKKGARLKRLFYFLSVMSHKRIVVNFILFLRSKSKNMLSVNYEKARQSLSGGVNISSYYGVRKTQNTSTSVLTLST